ncbi:hypothetical protein MPD5_0391 [Melissococcus plutonius DAT561]|nr:hypothetical protein MPD5_0391 [Melissococcus plutonius DAT561]
MFHFFPSFIHNKEYYTILFFTIQLFTIKSKTILIMSY